MYADKAKEHILSIVKLRKWTTPRTSRQSAQGRRRSVMWRERLTTTVSLYNKRSNCSHLKPPRPVPRCLWIDYSTTPFVCMTNGTFMTVDTANGCNTNKLHVSFKITLNRQLWWQMYGGNWFLRPQTWRPNHNIRMMATALCPCVQAPYLVVLPGDWLLGKWYVLPWTDTDKSWIRNKR